MYGIFTCMNDMNGCFFEVKYGKFVGKYTSPMDGKGHVLTNKSKTHRPEK